MTLSLKKKLVFILKLHKCERFVSLAIAPTLQKKNPQISIEATYLKGKKFCS